MSDKTIVIGMMEVRKQKYAVSIAVSEATSWRVCGAARFLMNVFGKDLYADTWEDLYKKALLASKQAAVKVNVPLLKAERESYSNRIPGFSPVTLTGRHTGTGNYLIQRQVGTRTTKEQTDAYSLRSSYYLPMSKEEQAEGIRLRAASERADAAWQEWNKAHEADLNKLFEEAEREALEKIDAE